MAELANDWVQPTRFAGEYPSNWAGYTFLQWDQNYKVFHPGVDYNWGAGGDDDLGQDAVASSSGTVIHTSKSTAGYGNLVVIKHALGYNIKRFIKETYNIDCQEIYTLYAHLNDIKTDIGKEVKTGELIGHVGKTGTAWAHLHFEVYAPIGELKMTDWRFYPVGWSKEKVQEFYLPAYDFIESTKHLESYENFLGKTKEYWLQVEQDRIDLLKQLSDNDRTWADKLKNSENKISTLTTQIANLEIDLGKAQDAQKSFDDKLRIKDDAILACKNKNIELLKGSLEGASINDLFRVLGSRIAQNMKL